jgi:integrase
MKKGRKNTVGVESFRGMLRLRLPRSVFAGKQKYIYLGIADTPRNRKISQAKAQLIEAEIILEKFDFSLERYKPIRREEKIAESPNLAQLWARYTAFKSSSLSVTTINTDFRKVRNHINNLPTQSLNDSKQIKKILLTTLSPGVARRTLVQLRACCNWAMEEGLIESNPFDSLPKMRIPKTTQIDPFTREERNQIIEAFDLDPFYHHYASFVRFLFWTGCRTSEAVGLQWRHLDNDLTLITFSEAVVGGVRKDTKTHKIRRFPVNETLRQLLADLRPADWQPDGLVFLSKAGCPIDPHNFLNRAWKGVMSKLPIRYRKAYNTRHTFITLCLEEGMRVTQVAAWVGNSPKTIWEHYAGLLSLQQVPDL